MNALQLQTALETYTAEHCGIEERKYISMSRISNPIHALYDQLAVEKPSAVETVARSMKFLSDRELKDAFLYRLDGAGLSVQYPVLLEAYDGLVQGHPDAFLDGTVVQIKPCTFDAYLEARKAHRLPDRDFEQLQAYLHYSKRQWALAIYVNRETGEFYTVQIRYDPRTANRLDAKLKTVVEAYRKGVRPDCPCQRCRREIMTNIHAVTVRVDRDAFMRP